MPLTATGLPGRAWILAACRNSGAAGGTGLCFSSVRCWSDYFMVLCWAVQALGDAQVVGAAEGGSTSLNGSHFSMEMHSANMFDARAHHVASPFSLTSSC